GTITLNAGEGNDEIDIRNSKADTIYTEAGNDIVYLNNADLSSDTLLYPRFEAINSASFLFLIYHGAVRYAR
ncbi:MAG: hypothetical protein HOG33_04095, partial [Candidatus Marinimicrobia bacterium]|nr:hypothetical protein [Candidatus Neomarinimicrobiota bacterium]